MKKNYFLIIFTTVLIVFGFHQNGISQLLLNENFAYPAGDLLTAQGWTAHSGAGTQAITVNNGGLSFTGYIGSGVGNAALIDNTGEDDNKTFAIQSAGTVYTAFMVNIANVSAGYFFHIGGAPIGTTFRGRVFMDATNHFGVSVGSGAAFYSTSTFTVGSTYLLVLKYEITAGTNNDIVSLYVFDTSAPTSEPGTPTLGPFTDAGQTDILPGSVALRQYSAIQNVLVDGIRVGMTWADIIPSMATPSVSTSVSTLSGFQYFLGAGPSVSQSYNLSGANLAPAAGNLTVTGTAHFEVSTDNITFSNSVNVAYAGATLAATPIYVRMIAGFPVGNYNLENIANTGGGASAVNVSCSGSVVKAEPSNHATAFTAVLGIPAYATINTSWVDAVAGTTPDGYIVKGSNVSYAAIANPVDGIPETNSLLVKNVTQGTQAAAFNGLTDNTTYYFKIFPYSNSGSFINYKTDGTVPTATATTPFSPSVTYTWIGAEGALWTTATNWTPTRTTPNGNDHLIFTGGGSKTVTGVPTQSVGRISVSTNTTINLQAPVAAVLTITGVTGADIDVPVGCALNLSGSFPVTIAIATTATASISGTMMFSSASSATAHKITGVDPASITFNSGAVFVAGQFFSGNAFGNGTPGSVIFANGSTYTHYAGSNPFANNNPNSVCVFQTGSLYKLTSGAIPSFSGKTYANFEMDAPTFTVTTTGGSAVSIDNLVITNGTLNFNMTGTPGHLIKGNITVATGGTLNFSPVSAGTVIMNGTSTQVISGPGTLTSGVNSTLGISNPAGVTLGKSISLNGHLNLTDGFLTLGSNNLLLGPTSTITGTPSATAMVVATGTGSLQKGFPAAFTGNFVFPVGDNTGTAEYSPVTVNFAGGTFATGNYVGVNVVNAKYPGDPNTTNYLKRYWGVTSSGITGINGDATFKYVTADVMGTEASIYCLRVLPTPFVTFNIANTALHQLTATGLADFGTFTGSMPAGPTVQTLAVTNITNSTATGNGNVTSDGGATVTAKGVCWGTTANPTITGPHTTEPGGTGVFASNMTGLAPQTLYYVRAYATNLTGTVYGNQVTFTTLCQPLPPVVNFYADRVTIMAGDSINFFDQSLYCPTYRKWSFVGGTPSESFATNPTNIKYNYPGTYTVCLDASNSYGMVTHCKTAYITVIQPPQPLNAKIVITEISYNPPESGIDSLEYIELYNNDTVAMNVDSFYFSRGVVFTFPNTTMAPHSYLVVAQNAGAMLNTYGITALEWTNGSLNNGGEQIVLYDRMGVRVDSVDFDDSSPWDTLADGWGPSLELCDPDLNNNIGSNWRAATEFVGTNASGDSIWGSPGTGCAYAPTAGFIASDSTIMQYESVIFTDLSSSDATSWLWTFEGGLPGTYNGKTPPPVVYNNMGAFDVTLKVSNNAGHTTLVKQEYIQVGPSGFSSISGSSGLLVFPNPTKGAFTVQFKSKNLAVVQVVDQLGNIVFEANQVSNKTLLTPAGLIPGLYFVRVIENETGITRISKLIIQ
jgi:PKD repeat protein